MDRRQRKTRDAIFSAFIELLSKKNYGQITVGEIIEKADIGRATFYAHFETKDFLLKELCEELFCHIFDVADSGRKGHRHIFECEAPIAIGKPLKLSPAFPPLSTVRATFIAHSAPSLFQLSILTNQPKMN